MYVASRQSKANFRSFQRRKCVFLTTFHYGTYSPKEIKEEGLLLKKYVELRNEHEDICIESKEKHGPIFICYYRNGAIFRNLDFCARSS